MEANPYLPPQSEIIAPESSGRFEYAGFWRRVAASIIDSVLITVITMPLLFLLYGADALAGDELFHGPMEVVLNYVFPLVAAVWFWKARGATPGKMAMKIKIVSVAGESLGLGQCVGRYFGYILSALPIGLGYFWMLWDDRQQTWHDKLAGTLVVRTDYLP